MLQIPLSGYYAVYRGVTLEYRSQHTEKGLVFLSTPSAALAQELGFAQRSEPNQFFGCVSKDDISEYFHQSSKGALDGDDVSLMYEIDERYGVYTVSRKVAVRWGFSEIDRGLWAGEVPKSLVTNVRHQRRPWNPW